MKTRRVLPPAFGLLAFIFLALPVFCLRAEEHEDQLARFFENSDLAKVAAEQKDLQVYRLTILRSFDDPLQILIESGGYSQIIVKKVRREVTGPIYSYTKLTRDSQLKVSGETVKTLGMLLEAAQFWKLPASDARRMGLDGSSWTLEVVRDGKYHKVAQDNPFLPVPVFEDLEKLSTAGQFPALNPGQAYGQGLLAAAFTYMWALSGEDAEDLY